MPGPPSPLPTPLAASRWRASPSRLVRLLSGLWLFGAGEALVVAAQFGNSPWTVLAQGVSRQTPLSIGSATILISVVVLLLWLPLRQRPGLGTVLNAVVIGVAIDVTLTALSAHQPGPVRAGELLLGVALVALGSGLYLGVALGPGPRDGLMIGLHRRTGRPVGRLRTGVELLALCLGTVLGGTVGVGTALFAIGIGPAVALALRALGGASIRDL